MPSLSSYHIENLEKRIKNARGTLLAVVIFTVINAILLVTQSYSYFLFSAFVPYALVSLGMDLCGFYPPEYYGADYYLVEFLPPAVFYVFLAIAIVIMTIYFVLWLCSAKHPKAMFIVAVVLFSMDTFAMIGLTLTGDSLFSSAIDLIFHIWVLVSLVLGVIAAAKKKKCIASEEMSAASVLGGTEMPQSEAAEESAPTEEEGKPAETTSATMPDSVPLRKSERHVKHRMLLSYNALGHEIEYRRVKKTNELVIDGNVYAEYTALMERSHQLTAMVDGHRFEVGFDSLSSQSYISIDGQLVHSKLRWY